MDNEQIIRAHFERNTFDIPESRKYINRSNLYWLLRNLRINNADNPHLSEMETAVSETLRELERSHDRER